MIFFGGMWGVVKKCFAALVGFALMLLTNTAFADVGVFLKDITLLAQEGTNATTFSQGARVYISGENENQYIISEQNDTYYADKQDLITITKKIKIYKLKDIPAAMYSEADFNSSIVKELGAGELLSLIDNHGEFGLFNTQDEKKGYVYLSILDEIFIEKENISLGTATAAMTVKNKDNKYLHIRKADILYIKDFRDSQFILLDEEGNEFAVNPLLVSLNKENVQLSRASFNRNSVTNVSKVIEYAHNAIGKPYAYAQAGNKGYDCSGLTYAAYQQISIKLPRSSSEQAGVGTTVKKEDLIAGDLIFFDTTGKKRISHVGIYIGDGKMIHASTGQKKVVIEEVNSSYYKNRFVTARRIIEN